MSKKAKWLKEHLLSPVLISVHFYRDIKFQKCFISWRRQFPIYVSSAITKIGCASYDNLYIPDLTAGCSIFRIMEMWKNIFGGS